MKEKVLGIDLGTNSIGISVRNENLGDNLKDQLEYFSSDVFKSGVGNRKSGKSGEFSYAAERAKHRRSRGLYEHRRRRLWKTLELLIKEGLCPMSLQSLKCWSVYDKNKKLFRKYPIDDVVFNAWIKLDFNGDGKPDYSSPYQLRRLLATEQMDFSLQENRFKLGRALYHIAQRRGFKSSKGETISEQEKSETSSISEDDIVESMKKSEIKLSKGLDDFISKNNLHTIGEAFAMLEDQGERVRNNADYKAVRCQYEKEIRYIFEFQNDLSIDSNLFRCIISKKKGEGTIFYKCPLRSQKGKVGKCVLEKNKRRCPIGKPEYEEFRAWCFINNIKIKQLESESLQVLSDELRNGIYKDVFLSTVAADFSFSRIRHYIEKFTGVKYSFKDRTINYNDNVSVGGCPVTVRFINMLGEEWRTLTIPGSKMRESHSKKSNEKHIVSYTATDLWNICFESDDPEDVKEFAKESLGWDDERIKLLIKLWSSIREGYASLSLKSINNINRQLRRGLIYSDAVMLAKIPCLVRVDDSMMDSIICDFQSFTQDAKYESLVVKIVNTIIANYKSLDVRDRFADHNYEYILNDTDKVTIEKTIIDCVGSLTWQQYNSERKEALRVEVAKKYQAFFAGKSRNFLKALRLQDWLKEYLKNRFPHVPAEKWDLLYHPSQIAFATPLHVTKDRSEWRLPSPNLGAIKNPLALRTLHVLQRKVNAMLDAAIISPEDTRVVVETTREMNDSNHRWAIQNWQDERKKENENIAKILCEFYPQRYDNNVTNVNQADKDKARYVIEQGENNLYLENNESFAKDITKYKLWLEQGCQCMYTGKVISLSNLFDDNCVDLEHTLPRSMSFDSSDANLTVCDAHYNRYIKCNHLPTELPNYEKEYIKDGIEFPSIKSQLNKWMNRIENLRSNVELWHGKARKAQTKDRRDSCIRQRLLWKMELDYWQEKYSRFTMTDVTDGFRNRQLVDTGIITRYAALYLKSVFQRVEVEKGSVTAVFRKILGIQSIDEKKDRTLHSHHAIDATMLTVMPIAAKRDRMLQLFYDIEEHKEAIKRGYNVNIRGVKQELEGLEIKLKRELEECHIGHKVSELPDFIKSHILVNHHFKDQTMTPARQHSDCIRFDLHKTSYYGVNRLPMQSGVDFERKPMTDKGSFVYPDKNKLTIVMRTDVTSFGKKDDLNRIVDFSLRQMMHKIVEKRMASGLSFKDAINKQPIWMVDKEGNEIKTDKNGRALRPIRHIRCLVKAGRGGVMSFEKSLKIRENINMSTRKLVNIDSREHKKYVYAQNGGNYLCLLYEGIKNGQIVRFYRFINYFEAAKLKKLFGETNFENQLQQESYYKTLVEKKVLYHLTAIIKVGYRVVKWEESPSEVLSLSKEELLKRLYIVKKFNKTKSEHIYLRSHLKVDDSEDQKLIKLIANKFNCLIEYRDFEIDRLGNITFKNIDKEV